MKYDLTKEEIACFYEGVVSFNIRTQSMKKVKFKVWHNLGEMLLAAIQNWSVRTTVYTAESLCKYINDKNSGHICLTEKEWQPYYKKLFNLN